MDQSNQQRDARRIVEQFIQGVNKRNADAVRTFSGVDIRMTFPGKVIIRSIDDFFEWLKGRSPRSVYIYDNIDVVIHSDRAVAYASGHMEGVTANGIEFKDVRVLDKFVIQNGLVVSKDAWSDMADFMRQSALAPTSTK